MKFLLDTHVFLWLLTDSSRIRSATLDLLAAPDSARQLSAASIWEMAIKHGQGRLPLPDTLARVLRAGLVDTVTSELPVLGAHALGVHELPGYHGDPFDRLLVAQARIERLTLVTADPQIMRYDVDLLAA